MKLILVQIFTFLITTSFAQQWIDSNAQWHYGWWSIGGIGYTEINYTGDTTINGQNCQKLVPTNHSFGMDQWGMMNYIGAIQWPTEYTYSNGDTVFWLVDTSFDVLYNFGEQQGDSWDLGIDTNSFLCSYSIEHVDSSGTTIINSSTLKWVSVSADSLASYGFNGKAIEGIGQVDDYLFPLEKNCDPGIAYDPPFYHFNCFSSDSFTLYNPSGDDCDFPMQQLGIQDLENQLIKIFPNPAQEHITLSLPKNERWNISIYSATGILVYSLQGCIDQKTIDISELETGIYICQVSSDNAVVIGKRIIKQ